MSKVSPLASLKNNIARVILGKDETIEMVLVCLLARGHLLLEDVPGLGKTVLSKALCKSLGLGFKRVQCTPDILPSDITGISVFNQQTSQFEFIRGPVFSNLLLCDEINRSTPRTQSALLECMAESQVTVDGETYKLDDVFMVIATQNPCEFQGTFPLPEAQRDRFFMRLSLGYPDEASELKMLSQQNVRHPLDSLTPVVSREKLVHLQGLVARVRVHPDVSRYISQIVRATRGHEKIELGASPRGSLALMKASQALALVRGRTFVTPDLVKELAKSVLSHRLITIHHDGDEILDDILSTLAVPTLNDSELNHAGSA
ncbi:MAG: hypothetical protein COB04_16685 [Gammaproteobacteria bacterium]|nr:MAG: hypothetical protein COB04_16685 [Gammaproteobacteria bacterium]